MRRVITVLIALALVGGWGLALIRRDQTAQPGGQTLAEVLAKLPEPEQRTAFTQAGREHLALFGRVPAVLTFPSGPPVYVFDKTGRLVDWTPDIGDDESFNDRWPGVYRGRAITQEEVLEWPKGSR